MEAYNRVGVNRPDNPQPNEIRITTQGKMRKYILYAITLLEEKQMTSIILRAMGKTIAKAVSIAEILKKRFPLHQITEIGSTEIEEIYQPSVEGLDEIKHTKRVSSISITLSQMPLDPNALGYQAPVPSPDHGKVTHRPRPQFQQPVRGGMVGGRGTFVNRRGGRGGRGGFQPPPMQQQQFSNYEMYNRNQGRPQRQMNQNYPPPMQQQQFPTYDMDVRNQGRPQRQINQNYPLPMQQQQLQFTPFDMDVRNQGRSQRPINQNYPNLPLNPNQQQMNQNNLEFPSSNNFQGNRGPNRGRGGRGRGRGGYNNNNFDGNQS